MSRVQWKNADILILAAYSVEAILLKLNGIWHLRTWHRSFHNGNEFEYEWTGGTNHLLTCTWNALISSRHFPNDAFQYWKKNGTSCWWFCTKFNLTSIIRTKVVWHNWVSKFWIYKTAIVFWLIEFFSTLYLWSERSIIGTIVIKCMQILIYAHSLFGPLLNSFHK